MVAIQIYALDKERDPLLTDGFWNHLSWILLVIAFAALAIATSEKLGNWDQFSAQKLSHQSYDRAISDSQVLSAFRKWRTCMKAAGYDYRSPMKLLEVRWKRPVGKRGEREIATALDDIKCRQSANVTGIWNAVEAAYEQRHIDENPEIYSDLKRSRQRYLESAAKALHAQN